MGEPSPQKEVRVKFPVDSTILESRKRRKSTESILKRENTQC